jgi:hypothetical protein
MSTLATNAITDASGGNTATINGYAPTVSNMAGRNRIINGDMRIDQRNAGASVTPANADYTLDRWRSYLSQASKYSVQQNAGSVTPPAGFINYLGVTSLSAYSVGSGEFFSIQQFIEGFNVADLGWGTANAQAVTLSFKVYSSLTGTFGGVLQNDGQNRSYPFTYSIPTANTWTTISVTVSGDTSGTWLTNSGRGIAVWFGLGAGSSLSGTAGAWAAAGYFSATGATSVVGTSGATFYITGVQLEAGSVATPFEHRQYGTELALCQRYYQQITHAGSTIAYILGTAYDATNIYSMSVYSLPVTMRSAPTFSTAGTFVLADGLGANPPASTLTFSSMSMANSFTAQIVSSGMTTGRVYFLVSTASSALKISAEL